MIVFEGISDDSQEINVHILEIKTGKSKLTSKQKAVKKAILENRFFWKEINLSEFEIGRDTYANKDFINSLTDKSVTNTSKYFEANANSKKNNINEKVYSLGYSFQDILDNLHRTFALKYVDSQMLKKILDKYIHFSRTDLFHFKTESSASYFFEQEEIKDYSDIYYNDECIDFLNENFHILIEEFE